MAGTVVLTGATSGIGLATAAVLAARADRLVLHGPGPRDDAWLDSLRAGAGARVDYVRADYSRLAEVPALARDVAALVPRVDVLVNNAGRPGRPRREVTPDGHEATWQVNYLAPVLLTEELLRLGAVGRVVDIASATHYGAVLDPDDLESAHGYHGPAAYARSKLALVTYSCWLARERPGVEVVAMHPGVVATDLLHAMFAVGGVPPQAAADDVAAVVARHGDSGTYYDERRPAAPDAAATDPATQRWLRERTVAALRPYRGG